MGVSVSLDALEVVRVMGEFPFIICEPSTGSQMSRKAAAVMTMRISVGRFGDHSGWRKDS